MVGDGLSIIPSYHSSTAHKPRISVDVYEDRGSVELCIEDGAAGEHGVSRILTAEEARALAAALVHYAKEATTW